MVIQIPKGTPEHKIKSILNKRKGRSKVTPKNLDAFFGKLPKIEDGLSYQKKARSEWK